MGLIDNKHIEYQAYSLGEGERHIRIAHLSDTHFPRHCVDTAALLKALSEKGVRLVLFSGDLICRTLPLPAEAFGFMRELASRFPVYFAEGNHEYAHPLRAEIAPRIEKCGVTVVTGRWVQVAEGLFVGGASEEDGAPMSEEKGYRILLAHHPERYHVRLPNPPDLILSGHAHGGQFRLFGQGMYAPGQGIFPRYTAGLYDVGESTQMLVSRGIGKSRFPFRFNNRPHVPIIDLYY